MNKAIIYVRAKASLSDFDLASISAQVLTCKDYAEKNGLEIVGLYTDIFLFGAERVFNSWELIMRLKKPPFDTVLVYDMSRIGRNTSKVCNDCDKLKERGVRVVSATNTFPAEMQDTWFEFLKCCEEYMKKEQSK